MEGKTRGQVAYEAYGESSGWKSLANGSPLPQWADVKPKVKEAWESSAEKLLAAFPVVKGENSPEVEVIQEVNQQLNGELDKIAAVLREKFPDEFPPTATLDRIAVVATGLLEQLRECRGAEVQFASGIQVALEGKPLPADAGEAAAGGYELVQALKRKVGKASPLQRKFGGVTYHRTGRLIELRLAETGSTEQEILNRITEHLEQAGIGQH